MIVDSGACPLYIAAASGRYGLACRLVRSGTDVNVRCFHTRESALHGACAEPREWMSRICNIGRMKTAPVLGKEHLELIGLLLTRGANVNHQETDFGFTPLHMVCSNDAISAVDPLNDDVMTEKVSLVKDLLRLLLKNGAKLTSKSYSDFPLLPSEGGIRPAKPFVPSGATPLHLACATGNKVLVAELLSAGADVNATCQGGFTSLHCAMLHKPNLKIVKLLIKYGAKINQTATFKSSSGGSIKYMVPVSILMMNSIFKKTGTSDQNKLQLDAVLDILTLMLELGCDCGLDAKDSTGRTPYHHAVEQGNTCAVKLICTKTHDLSVLETADASGTHPVCRAGNTETLVWLLRKGVPLPPGGYVYLDRRGSRANLSEDLTRSLALLSAGVPLSEAALREYGRDQAVMSHPAARAALAEVAPLLVTNLLRRESSFPTHVPSLSSLSRYVIRKRIYSLHSCSVLPYIFNTGLPPLVANSFLVMVDLSD